VLFNNVTIPFIVTFNKCGILKTGELRNTGDGGFCTDGSPVNAWISILRRFMTFSIITTIVKAAKIDIGSLYTYS